MAVFQTILEQYRILNTTVYAIPMEKFRELPIKRWKSNRPADTSRVNEIHNWMKQFNRMDGVINLACIGEEGLVCFEGNHRRMALKNLDFPVLVDIVWNATDESVTHEFRRINESISVPDLYVEETDAVIIANIVGAVTDFVRRYPTHLVPSARPQRPNFNRDNFTQELFRIQKELNISIADMMTRIYALNEKFALADKIKLSANTMKKCSTSGLWLFAWSQNINL